MYAYLGPQTASSPMQMASIAFVLTQAHGIVLELGPGGGDQTFHFETDKVDKIYGAEPNAHFHPALIAKANEAGLDGRYVPVKAGAQPGSLLPELQKLGLLPQNISRLPEGGVFDSIVAVKSICSVPPSTLSQTMEVIKALLKPGGQFLFFEHLQNSSNFFTRWYTMVFNNFIWPALMGDCRLDGKLDQIIMGMSGWDKVAIENVREYEGHEVFRYALGVCTKA